MKSNNLAITILVLLPLLFLSGCGGGGSSAPAGPSVVRITVTPANTVIATSSTLPFTATATLSDGTTRDVTSQVTWSDSGVVQISSTGQATSSTTSGTVTITASLGSVSGSTLLTVTGGNSAGANAMLVTVNGSLCSSATSVGYFNKPCVSVTVCNPDGSVCQEINDILLDTGSYGLRVFKQAIPNLTLPQVTSTSGASIAECIHFADGTTVWGPVKRASVKLGNEPAVQVPVQVIDAGFATPTFCSNPAPDPGTARYTGILGVGPLAQDCGDRCANFANVGFYFGCTGATCAGTQVSLPNQVQNPVAGLPADRNGVLVQLPSVPPGGVSTISGSLFLGIGTQANNTPAAPPTVFPTDLNGEFTTQYRGTNLTSFLDTGSNGLFFPNIQNALTVCGDWYCSTTSLSAVITAATGAPSANVQFNVSNANSLFATSNNVFSDIAGPLGSDFDWGLPFFMGRNVFMGIQGTTSPLGTGPYVAY